MSLPLHENVLMNPSDPFDTYTDTELWHLSLYLQLACGRAKSVFKAKNRGALCSAAELVNGELSRRSRPFPTPPLNANNGPPFTA